MRALWDHPCLPYKVCVPWPKCHDLSGHISWVHSVDLVESWLEQYIGPHWTEWTWAMWSLHNPYYCGVSFSREPSCSLFLLRFGSADY